jgi:cytochrome c biogenesis protein CcmG/thiol:disulfide interchange protein DsbE
MGMLNQIAKYSFAILVVTGLILICSPFARMRLQQTSTGFQAQTERDAVAYFNLENVAGGFMTSEDLKGKVTVVDLWATWCKPCIDEIPIYNRLYDAFKSQDVAIVGIAVSSPPRDIPSKVRQLGIKYPVLIGDDKAVQAFGGVRGFPTTVVISREGKIYKRYMGAVRDKEQKIKQDIERLSGGRFPGASAKNHFMLGLIFFHPVFMTLTDEAGSLP